MCSKKISLSNNSSGLVFNDKHFLCEDCCSEKTDEEINHWTKNIMQSGENGMPIALWLIHEQNKNKFLMTTKKME